MNLQLLYFQLSPQFEMTINKMFWCNEMQEIEKTVNFETKSHF